MGLQEDFDALKGVQDSVNKRVLQLERENKSLKQLNNILVAEKTQWEQQKELQAQVIAQQLQNSDNIVRQLQNEILDLKEKLKG